MTEEVLNEISIDEWLLPAEKAFSISEEYAKVVTENRLYRIRCSTKKYLIGYINELITEGRTCFTLPLRATRPDSFPSVKGFSNKEVEEIHNALVGDDVLCTQIQNWLRDKGYATYVNTLSGIEVSWKFENGRVRLC